MVWSGGESVPYRRRFFLEKFLASPRVEEVTHYSLFTFEPLQNLYIGISKLLKKCTVECLLSDKLRTGKAWDGTKALVIFRAQVLRGCNLLLSDHESNGELPGICIDISKQECQMDGT